MELEGVLGLVVMLRELVRPMRMLAELYSTSQTSQKKGIYFFCKNPGNQRIYETNFLIFLLRTRQLGGIIPVPSTLATPRGVLDSNILY